MSNGTPIPQRHAFSQTYDETIRLRELERMVDAIRRNVEEMLRRSVDSRNLVNDSIQLRHLADEIYGDEDDLTNLRFGDAEAVGVAEELARADHKHALDALLQLSVTTPAQITANQNDYNPGTLSFFRLESDAARNITGFAGGADGRHLFIANIGSFSIVIQNQNAASVEANRIITGTGADVTLAPDDTAWLIYDITTARWRLFA